MKERTPGICHICGDKTGDGSTWCQECWDRLAQNLIMDEPNKDVVEG
jgi:hypothetical protein